MAAAANDVPAEQQAAQAAQPEFPEFTISNKTEFSELWKNSAKFELESTSPAEWWEDVKDEVLAFEAKFGSEQFFPFFMKRLSILMDGELVTRCKNWKCANVAEFGARFISELSSNVPFEVKFSQMINSYPDRYPTPQKMGEYAVKIQGQLEAMIKTENILKIQRALLMVNKPDKLRQAMVAELKGNQEIGLKDFCTFMTTTYIEQQKNYWASAGEPREKRAPKQNYNPQQPRSKDQYPQDQRSMGQYQDPSYYQQPQPQYQQQQQQQHYQQQQQQQQQPPRYLPQQRQQQEAPRPEGKRAGSPTHAGSRKSSSRPPLVCTYCGFRGHVEAECRTKLYQCDHCHKRGHTIENCKNKEDPVSSINIDNADITIYTIGVECLADLSKSNSEIMTYTEAQGLTVAALLDTGAGKSLCRPEVVPSNATRQPVRIHIKCANDSIIQVKEAVVLNLYLWGKQVQWEFLIVPQLPSSISILCGRDFIEHFHVCFESNHVFYKTNENEMQISDLSMSSLESQTNTQQIAKTKTQHQAQSSSVHNDNEDNYFSDLYEDEAFICEEDHLMSVLPLSEAQPTVIDIDEFFFDLAQGNIQQEDLFMVTVQPEETLEDSKEQTVEELIEAEKRPNIRKLLEEYKDIFQQKLTTLAPIDEDGGYEIKLKPGQTPTFQRPYPLSVAERQFVKKQLTDLLRAGIITPSLCQYGCPVLVAKPKGKRARMVINYKSLNQKIEGVSYTLPSPSNFFDKLIGGKLFSVLDCTTSFYLCRIKPESENLTTFVTDVNIAGASSFKFRALPMGMAPSSQVFAAYIEKILRHLDNHHPYIDDVCVKSNTDSEEDHIVELRKFFDVCRQKSLVLKLSKAQLCKKSIVFLGQKVSAEGVAPHESKVAALQKFPVPKNLKQVRGFLGLINFWRKMLPHIAETLLPLTELTKKAVKFVWDDRRQRAFDKAKQTLVEATTLAYPDPSLPYELHADASDIAAGSVLGQKGRPIAFFSRVFTKDQQKMSVRDRELQSIMWALEKFRTYLHGSQFTIKSDHKTLQTLLTSKIDNPKHADWLEQLSSFGLPTIQHIAGKDNTAADALSRVHIPEAELDEDTIIMVAHIESLMQDEAFVQKVRTALQKDKMLLDMAKAEPKMFTFKNELLFYTGSPRQRLCIPNDNELLTAVISACHDPSTMGHKGIKQTSAFVKQNYWIAQLNELVTEYVSSCFTCQINKYRGQKKMGFMQPIPDPPSLFHTFTIDFVTSLPEVDGFDSIAVAVEKKSKYVVLWPTSTKRTKEQRADEFFRKVICRFGVAHTLISDRDPSTTNDDYAAILK